LEGKIVYRLVRGRKLMSKWREREKAQERERESLHPLTDMTKPAKLTEFICTSHKYIKPNKSTSIIATQMRIEMAEGMS
jgi:hypothetical protein